MSFGQGWNDSVEHVVGGIIYTVIINALIGINLLPPNFTILLIVLNVIFIVAVILKLGLSGIIYLVGWLAGIGLLVYGGILNTGLVGIGEIAADVGIPLIFIGYKLYSFFNDH